MMKELLGPADEGRELRITHGRVWCVKLQLADGRHVARVGLADVEHITTFGDTLDQALRKIQVRLRAPKKEDV